MLIFQGIQMLLIEQDAKNDAKSDKPDDITPMNDIYIKIVTNRVIRYL